MSRNPLISATTTLNSRMIARPWNCESCSQFLYEKLFGPVHSPHGMITGNQCSLYVGYGSLEFMYIIMVSSSVITSLISLQYEIAWPSVLIFVFATWGSSWGISLRTTIRSCTAPRVIIGSARRISLKFSICSILVQETSFFFLKMRRSVSEDASF